jgi:hypothetical protein
MQKELFSQERQDRAGSAPRWLDLQSLAGVAVSSEDQAHTVQSALKEPFSAGWKAADEGAQTISLIFHQPQTISRIHVEFHEPERTRTQEFVLRWSTDKAKSYREIVRQQFNFQPAVYNTGKRGLFCGHRGCHHIGAISNSRHQRRNIAGLGRQTADTVKNFCGFVDIEKLRGFGTYDSSEI